MSEDLATPSRARLLATLAVTTILAAAILVIVVLPAEYQIDLTGLGRAIGLDQLRPAGVVTEPMEEATPGTAATYSRPHRSEAVTASLAAGEEMELKIRMNQGDTVLYSWELDRGVLYSDFHAEPFNDLEHEVIRYVEREDASSEYGGLTAPFAGLHGWYWHNGNEFPVEITLEVSGYFVSVEEIHRAMSPRRVASYPGTARGAE